MIYLDHAASTPLRPEAAAVLHEWLGAGTGRAANPSGAHAVAQRARLALEDARDRVAAAVGARPGEVVFTSGGTEALNLAVHGVGGTVVMSAVEHEAVRQPLLRAARRNEADLAEAPVDADGLLDLDRFERLVAARPPRMVAVMAVNNEVGAVQPIAEVRRLLDAHAPGARLLVDAVCAATWLDLPSLWRHTDLLAVSAHKFGGPAGIGALVVREGTPLEPLLLGGGQERERRSGTPAVAAAAAMAAALGAAQTEREAVAGAVRARRDRLVDALTASLDGVRETGGRAHKAPGHAHVCIDGVESESLLVLLDEAGVCASAGSACASGALHASHTLLAMGIPKERALGSLRLTLAATTTVAEVDEAAAAVVAAVGRLRP